MSYFQGEKQVISIHIGQAGVQVGNSCWELYCLEHGIQHDGLPFGHENSSIPSDDCNASNGFFSESAEGKHVPRAVFIDLEPNAVDQIRTGPYRQLFESEQLISGKENAASNYARGRYTIGREISDLCLDRIRKLSENCDNLDGFLVFSSVGGGTGSGLGSLLLEKLSVDYGKKARTCFTVYPSPKISNVIVEPYNAVLSTHSLLEHADSVFMLDNEALYDICQTSLNVEKPTYQNMNRIIAQLTSSLTVSMRFGGFLNSLHDFKTILIPYPRLHFLMSSFVPIVSNKAMSIDQMSIAEISQRSVQPNSMLVRCNPRYGGCISCCVMYRGDIIPKDVNVLHLRRNLQFVDWNPVSIKCIINKKPPMNVPGSDLAPTRRDLCTIFNNSSIAEIFSRIGHKFDMMMSKRAFVNWYVDEGMEEGSFTEAREELAALQDDYEQMGTMFQEEPDDKL